MIHYEPRWGKGRRLSHAIPPDILKQIRAGNKETDAEIARKIGRRPLSIRNIRYGQRHGDE